MRELKLSKHISYASLVSKTIAPNRIIGEVSGFVIILWELLM